jgi:hypothetical protein
MNGKANRAEVFMKAFESLSKAEKRVVVSRLLDDPQLREEVLDIGTVRECETEPTRPLEKNLADRGANEG